jgi:chromosome partitioning protein
MGRVVCFANQKGGVGKTSTCVNLCAAVREKNRPILLIDADPQGNATTGMGVNKHEATSLYDVLINGVPAEEAVVSTPYGDIIPANIDLSGASVELVGEHEREYSLRRAIEPLRDRYEYIFIDCPPSLGLLTVNALVAADSVLIPVQCEYYAMEGLADLIKSIRMIKKRLNPTLEIEGILLTMFDRRLSFTSQVSHEIRRAFKGGVYDTVIPRNVRIAEAPSHGKPINLYDPHSVGASAYRELAREFLKMHER